MSYWTDFRDSVVRATGLDSGSNAAHTIGNTIKQVTPAAPPQLSDADVNKAAAVDPFGKVVALANASPVNQAVIIVGLAVAGYFILRRLK